MVKGVLVREIPRVVGTATFVLTRNGSPSDPDRGIVVIVIHVDLVVDLVVGLVFNNDSTCPNRDTVSNRSTATGTSRGTGSRRIVVFLGRPTLEWVVREVEVEVQEPLGTMVMEDVKSGAFCGCSYRWWLLWRGTAADQLLTMAEWYVLPRG